MRIGTTIPGHPEPKLTKLRGIIKKALNYKCINAKESQNIVDDLRESFSVQVL